MRPFTLLLVICGVLLTGHQIYCRLTIQFESLVSSHGFMLLNYTAKTLDGYHLTIHRVVHPSFLLHPNRNYSAIRKPLILQHGLFGTSINFFANSPIIKNATTSTKCADSLGFCLLATERYDLFLPNVRGNGFSDQHEWLNVDDEEFWRFNLDHIASFDLPAVIALVQRETGRQKIGYLGYSQGATTMFALLSLRPHYATIISPFIAWAPPVFIGQMTSSLRYLDTSIPILQRIGGPFKPISLFKFLSSVLCGDAQICHEVALLRFLTSILCGRFHICKPALTTVAGQTDHLNEAQIPHFFDLFSAPTSTWTAVHFGQLYSSRAFRRFDYQNTYTNTQIYGQPVPPEYPLANIPPGYSIIIFYGATDAFVTEADINQLLGRLLQYHVNAWAEKVDSSTWNHWDFVFGFDAGQLLYEKTIRYLDLFY